MDNVIQSIPLINLITSEMHPHLEFQTDNLDNLINSIKKYGIIEPLLVRPKDNKFEIILGNRRYNAAKQLGLEKVPAIIANINDETALNIIISDNIQRKELSSKEEARLYDKALSFPNINKEQLSINLGIPLDRITSKLESLRKDTPVIENKQQEQEAQYQNENNSVNNDIISLSELNKERNERDEIYMNNNQFMENNMNNNLNNGVENNGQQAPTFGGRFFPSMEDEPTNMNMGGITPQPMPANNMTPNMNNNLNNSSPLIDLTDEETDINPELGIEQSTPNIPDMNQVQQPIAPEMPMQGQNPSMVVPNIPDINQAPMMGEQMPNVEQPMPNINQPLQGMNQAPIDGLNNDYINNDMMADPDFDENMNIPNIPDMNQMQQPVAPEIPMMEEASMNNMPNMAIQEPQMNIAPNNVPEQPLQEKNIVPVVNMIKNLAMSIESLGYKLNITESNESNSYNINIEVEK